MSIAITGVPQAVASIVTSPNTFYLGRNAKFSFLPALQSQLLVPAPFGRLPSQKREVLSRSFAKDVQILGNPMVDSRCPACPWHWLALCVGDRNKVLGLELAVVVVLDAFDSRKCSLTFAPGASYVELVTCSSNRIGHFVSGY